MHKLKCRIPIKNKGSFHATEVSERNMGTAMLVAGADISPSSTSILVREKRLLGSCFVSLEASGCAIPAALAREIHDRSLKFRFGTGFPFWGNPVRLSHCLFSEVTRCNVSPNWDMMSGSARAEPPGLSYRIGIGMWGGGDLGGGCSGRRSALF